MRHPRQVLTREQLLERVWGIDFEAETHVLEVYVGYLRNKLENGPGRPDRPPPDPHRARRRLRPAGVRPGRCAAVIRAVAPHPASGA